MTELMAEQESIRQENAERLDKLRQVYERQLVGLQSTVERLLHEGADKDDTIHKLTVRLSTADTSDTAKEAAVWVAEQHTEHHGSGQNGRRLVQQTELVQQLRDDVQQLQVERDTAQQNVDKLLHLLANAVQQQKAAGECISRHLGTGNGGSGGTPGALQHAGSGSGALRDSSSPVDERDTATPTALLHLSRGSTPRGRRRSGSREHAQPLEKSLDDTIVSDEGLDLSQQKLNESFLALLDLDTDGDEVVSDAGRTLQTSVDRLLEVLEQTRRQLVEARGARDELLAELLSHADDAERARAAADDDGLRAERDELAERLAHETAAGQRLAHELHSAEGVMDGYIADRERREEALREALLLRSRLEEQCSALRARVQLLEEQRADADAAQRLAERQHEAMAAASGTDEAAAEADASDIAQPALLRQNSQLDKERHEMSRQYEKDRRRLLDRIRELEQKVEDVSRANDELLEQSQTDKHDLELQLDALERQLRASKLFIEEQTHEREAEREEYQRDARKYQAVLDEKKRLEGTVGKLQNQIADLESQLQDADGNDFGQPRRRRGSAVGDFDDSPRAVQVDELKKVVRYLEVELETKSSQENELKERLVSMEAELVALTGLNGDLEAELKHWRQQEAMSLSASAIVVDELREQVSLSALQLAALRQERDALAAELERQRGADEELTHENNALRKQVNELLLQESALKSKLDSLKPSYHMGSGMASSGGGSVMADGHMAPSSGRLLHERVLACEEALEKSAAQINELTEQLAHAREQLAAKDEQLSAVDDRLAIDREHSEARHMAAVKELQSLLQAARDDNHDLLLELNSLKQAPAHIPAYAQKIIAEKNEELDHLNAQMEQLKDLMAESAAGKVEKELIELRTQLQKKDDAIQEKEEELFTATEELLAVQQQLEAIQGGNSFAQEEAAAHQLQLEETVSDLQQQFAVAVQTLEEARAAHAQTLLDVKRSDERKLDEMTALHANEVRAARQTEAEKWRAEVAAARQASEGVICQLRALLDEKEAAFCKVEASLTEAEAARHAHSSHQRELVDLRQQLQEKGKLLSEKEELVHSLGKEKTRLAQLRASLEDELSWHKLELQEKDQLMSLLQQQLQASLQRQPTPPGGSPPEELRVQLAAAVQALETERSQWRSEKLALGEQLSATALLLEAEQQRCRASEAAYGEQMKACKVEAEQQLQALLRELDEAKKELAAATSEAHVIHDKMLEDIRAEHEQSLKAAVAHTEREWQARLERERATHQATLTATVDEVKQNLKKAYRRHLASVLKTSRLSAEDPLQRGNGGSIGSRRSSAADSVAGSPALAHRAPPAGASVAAPTSSVMQQLLSQALVQGSEILALSHPLLARAAPDVHGWDADKSSLADAGAEAKPALASGGATSADLNNGDDDAEMDRLEERVQSLASRQAAAVDALLAADRRSLLGEIRELRAHLDLSRAQHDAVAQCLRDDLDEARRHATSRERQLQQQLQLAEYRSAQEHVALLDLRSGLDAERQSGAQLGEQLSAERSRCSALAADIKALDAEVGQLEQTVAWRDQQLSSLRRSMEEERGEHQQRVAELQQREQRVLDQLQRLAAPRQRLIAADDYGRTAREHEAALEKLKRDLASEKDRCSDAVHQADAERKRAAELRALLESSGAERRSVEAMYKDLVADLQLQLEEERATGSGLASRLEEEQQQRVELLEQLSAAEERRQTAEEAGAEHAAAQWRQQTDQLRALLDHEHGRCAELQASLDREAGRAAVTSAAAEAERRRLIAELDAERAVSGQLKRALDLAEGRCHESAKQAISDGENIKRLTNELDRMRSRVNLLQKGLEMEKQQQQRRSAAADDSGPSRAAAAERSEQTVLRAASARQQQQPPREARQDASRAAARPLSGTDLFEGMPASLSSSLGVSDESLHPGYDRASPRPAEEATTVGAPMVNGLHASSRRQPLGAATPIGDTIAAFRKQLEALRQRLRRTTLHLQGGAALANAGDSTAAAADLQDIADELHHLHGTATTSIERLAASPSLLSAANLDDIIRHNGELARFVAKLSEEKAELREALANLEEEVWLYRQRSTAEGESASSAAARSCTPATMRRAAAASRRAPPAAAASDAAALAVSLAAAEARAQRAEEKLRDVRSRTSEVEATTSPPSSERHLKERLRRAQSAWLRAESMRKSLVFQKRYLLLLLGGFQECEAAMLQAVSQMAATTTSRPQAADKRSRTGRGAAKFRSAAYAISAIRRMKILVSKWGKSSQATMNGAANGHVHVNVSGSKSFQRPPSVVARSRGRVGDGMDADDVDDSPPANVRTSVPGQGRSHKSNGLHLTWSSSLERPASQHHRDFAAPDRRHFRERSPAAAATRHRDRLASDSSSSDGTTTQQHDRPITVSGNGNRNGDMTSPREASFRPAMLSASHILRPSSTPPSFHGKLANGVHVQATSTAASTARRFVDGEVSGSVSRSSSGSHPKLTAEQQRSAQSVSGRGADGGVRSLSGQVLQSPTSRSPTVGSSHLSDDGSVDSQYLRRLENLQQQLAADLQLNKGAVP